MKNFKKGFIWMVILLVVIIVLAIGSVTYYLGKSSNISSTDIKNNLPLENQIVNNNKGDCLPTTKPWVKVLSPNGGETYTAGQQITVKWKSCNVPESVDVGIVIKEKAGPNRYINNTLLQQTPNDGNEMVLLTPSLFGNSFQIFLNFAFTDQYKGPWGIDGHFPEWADEGDLSDNFFTINSKSTNSVNADPYKRYVSKDCKVVSGCNGPIECVNKDSEPMASACVALPEFVCYKTSTARCEKQASGNCGWTYTETLKSCINSYSNKDLRKDGETCGENIGNCQTGLKCAYPCGIPGCQNICAPENSLPRP